MTGHHTVECPSCGEISEVIYRCEHCGKDLTGEETEGSNNTVIGP